jgi:enoyl-[acyl-carrier-protein] reductase (NADH)
MGLACGERDRIHLDHDRLRATQRPAFLCSPLASGITGTVLHVDKGFHAMAVPIDIAPSNLRE